MRHISLATVALAVFAATANGQSLVHGISPPVQPGWFKGNTHAHAGIWLPIPHGDSTPRRLARWYKEHGYQFLCISDHNKVGRESSARDLVDNGFIFLPGSEITSDTRVRLLYRWRNRSAPERVVHSTALDVDVTRWDVSIWNDFTPGSSVLDILRMHRLATEAAGGISIINHPNFRDPITAQEIIDSGIRFFEVYNAYPHSRNHGGGALPSTDLLWDQVLSTGTLLYGVASDDAHHTKERGRKVKEKMGIHAPAGGGWIMVRAPALTPAAITTAMQAGDFYSSSGVHLSDVVYRAQAGLTVTVDLPRSRVEVANDYVRAPARDASGAPAGVRIEFITQGGRVARTVAGTQGSVPKSLLTGYVRARVTYVEGGKAFYAWTQPFVVRP